MVLAHEVELGLAEAQGLADVADGALGAVAGDDGGERTRSRPVPSVEVLDDFFAALVFEVDVDVGRLVALAADEALEQRVLRSGSTEVMCRR